MEVRDAPTSSTRSSNRWRQPQTPKCSRSLPGRGEGADAALVAASRGPASCVSSPLPSRRTTLRDVLGDYVLLLFSVGHDLGSGAAAGAVEKLEPALARTIADVDNRLTAQETHVGTVVGGLIGQTSTELGARLGQVDGILEKRILQVQLGVDQVLDHGLDKIDGVARQRIAQIDSSLAARIKQVDGVAAKTLAEADNVLKTRIADLGQVVNAAVDRADQALGARIEQLDEVAGRRLGNVDVIATKQRLGLERTITRLAWLIALIVFVVVLLRALWNEYLKWESTIAGAAPGTARAWRYVTVLGKPLLRHALRGGGRGRRVAPSREAAAGETGVSIKASYQGCLFVCDVAVSPRPSGRVLSAAGERLRRWADHDGPGRRYPQHREAALADAVLAEAEDAVDAGKAGGIGQHLFVSPDPYKQSSF